VNAALYDALRERPEDFEFFDALRRLECAHSDLPRLSRSSRAAEDPVRLFHTPALAFPPRSLDRFEHDDGASPARLHSFVLGLFGPQAPLPLHLTEYALERQRHAGDGTLTAFADMFHHRMLSLFYRAWADAQPTVHMDRPGDDRFAGYVGALVGIATPHLASRDALPDNYRRHFAGRLAHQARNAEGLRAFLEGFFGVDAAVEEFVGEWMPLPDDARIAMGVGMAVLGQTAVIGAFVRGAQQRFRVRLGPLDRAHFDRFLPGGEALDQLTAAVRTYAGDEHAWDVQLVLKKDDVPLTHLGRSGRLGLSSWIGRYRAPRDADQVVLRTVR
jgi:type VI secretion system protein ImpH